MRTLARTVAILLATPTTVGPKTGQVLVSFTSQPGAVDAGSTVINVTGTAYEYASANVLGTVDLGSVRVGSALHGSFQATALPLTNLAVSATYGEKLSAAWGPTSSANVVVTGAVNALDPQASGGTLTVNLAPGLTPGDYAESATLTLTSVALAGSGLADATASQTVGIVGKVYAPAIGAAVTSLDLGMTRLGTNFAAKPVAVTNQAAGVNAETLKARLAAFHAQTAPVRNTVCVCFVAPVGRGARRAPARKAPLHYSNTRRNAHPHPTPPKPHTQQRSSA